MTTNYNAVDEAALFEMLGKISGREWVLRLSWQSTPGSVLGSSVPDLTVEAANTAAANNERTYSLGPVHNPAAAQLEEMGVKVAELDEVESGYPVVRPWRTGLSGRMP